MSGSSKRMRWLLLAVAACIVGAQGAAPPNVIFNAPGLLEKKPKPGLPDVKATPLAWPRLDPGAAFCRSSDDLDRLAANRAHTEGGGPADCQIIRVPTAVLVVTRQGPGHTQVRFKGQAATAGWTDVWLPERAPNPGAR